MEPPPLDPDLVAELKLLAAAITQRDDHADIAQRFEWLLDMLILRGQLPESFRKLSSKVGNDRSSVRLAMFLDKYKVTSPDIDCASLIPLCKARCCSLEVTLSGQDVIEGNIPFDVNRPYAMLKDPTTGTCVCKGGDGACTIYERRPGACRAYDCRYDARIWIDFDAKIPAP